MIFATMLALYLPMVVFGVARRSAAIRRSPRWASINRPGRWRARKSASAPALSALWAVTTTVTSNGSVNSMHDSMTPLGGLMPLIGMWLNNIFGGVGVGFINMLIFVIVAVFVAGMMIGRTPEFLGKKVEAKEMKLASLALLWHPLAILVGTAIACYVWATTADPGTALAWLKNPGAHGFSEMLYEFTSAAANNGSGFEGLGDNTPFWNISTGLVMLLSRYIPIIAPLALAGALAAKPAAPETAGIAARRQRDVRLHAVGGHRHSRPADVHAGRRARPDCRASGAEWLMSWSKNSSEASSSRSSRWCCSAAATTSCSGASAGSRFPAQAEGSLIRRADGTVVGSRLIAQKFARPEYFQPRPSGVDYNAASTGGTNYGPSNPDHLKAVQERLDAVDEAGGRRPRNQVPSEMVTASGAGWIRTSRRRRRRLQAARVAAAREVPVERVRELIRAHTEPPTFGFLGRARVNVLELNLALDEIR